MSGLTFNTHASSLLQRLHRGISAIELVYSSHQRWPFHPRRTSPQISPLRISILDSSFNPPTLAHLALANSPHPHHATNVHYDAKLLLLSVRNAEKSPKPSDPSYIQRLEMMLLFAEDIVCHQGENIDISSGVGHTEANVAVAIIDEPTFVGKSRILLPFLHHRLSQLNTSSPCPPSTTPPEVPKVKLTFLQGVDTLERLFSLRFYHSEADMLSSIRHFLSSTGDDSSIVCIRRSTSSGQPVDGTERTMAVAQEFVLSGHLAFIDIGEDERTFSSSEVRAKKGNDDEGWRKQVTDEIAEYIIKQCLYVGPV